MCIRDRYDRGKDDPAADNEESRVFATVRFMDVMNGVERQPDDSEPNDDGANRHPPKQCCDALSRASRRIKRGLWTVTAECQQ